MKKINSEIKVKNFIIPEKGSTIIKFSGSITSLFNPDDEYLDIVGRLKKGLKIAKSLGTSDIYYNEINSETTNSKNVTKLLIIDDMNSIIFLIKRHFEELGYMVDYATDGKKGISKIDGLRPDIILLDLMLPQVDGFEILQYIKSNPQLKNTKTIILSSFSKGDIIQKCIDNGADSYIVKPVSIHKLQEKIDSLVKTHAIAD